jgi:threonine dehydrogenase-like Zn-dependent dehydrogenase
MIGLKYDLKIWKVILRKMRIGSKYLLIKYRKDWASPQITHDNQILIKNRFAGICGSDYSQINADMSYIASILSVNQNPSPIGHELVGEVIKIGKNVSNFEIGDRVVY